MFKYYNYKKIAELEAELAECESKFEKQKEKYDKLYDCYKKTSSEDLKDKYRLLEEIEQFKQQLADKDKEIEELKQIKLLDDLHDASLTLLIGDKTRADLWALVEEHAMRELVLEERIKQEKKPNSNRRTGKGERVWNEK